MPQHNEKRALPYTPAQMFDMVADVARYPEFLPWCKAARVLASTPKAMTADLVIGYKLFSERYRSAITLDRPNRIEVKSVAGPLSHLTNVWEFKPQGRGHCAVNFSIDFDFSSPLLGAAMTLFFDKAVTKMVAAFETRAHEIYGDNQS